MKSVLKNEYEILSYLESVSDEIDEDLILDEFRGCEAHLKEVSITSLKFGPSENHAKSSSKQKRYDKMKLHTSPPIFVDENMEVIDGHHRIRSHLKQGQDVVWAYVVKS